MRGTGIVGVGEVPCESDAIRSLRLLLQQATTQSGLKSGRIVQLCHRITVSLSDHRLLNSSGNSYYLLLTSPLGLLSIRFDILWLNILYREDDKSCVLFYIFIQR